MRIAVIGLQGDVSEHVEVLRRALREENLRGEAFAVRKLEQLKRCHAAVIPGGESTTISKLLQITGMHEYLVQRASEGMPVMGTCAGCILLAKEGDEQVLKTDTKLLSLMEMAVDRNAFGRQRESFEADLDIRGLGPFHGVFIRAPAISRVWGRCEALSTFSDKIVMARQDNMLGLAFHPELSGDTKLHRWFLRMI